MKTHLEHFDDDARLIVTLALDEARLLGHDDLGDDHLLLGVARVAPDLVGVPIEALRARVVAGRGHRSPARTGAELQLDGSAERAISIASRDRGDRPVAPADVLAAVACNDGRAADALARIGVDSMADAPDYTTE